MRSRRSKRRSRVVLLADVEGFAAQDGLWSAPSADGHLEQRVRAAVGATLTDKQREAVEAYFFEGLSQGEIARRLNVSQQVVQKRIFGVQRGDKVIGGALARLRDALSDLV